MTIDQGKFLRLTSSIRATLDSLGVDGAAAKALSDAYTAYRAEAHLIADQQGLLEEFDRMFPPPLNVVGPGAPSARSVMVAASQASEAVGLLARLAGWLEGFTAEARLRAEAEAYAKVRLAHEGGN